MRRSGVRLVALVMTTVVLLAAGQASSQESAANRRAVRHDPAVTAFTTFVVGRELAYPADRAIVVAALDRLACAIEGLALAHTVLGDAAFARVHKLRRDIRRLAIDTDSPALTNERADTFVTVAQLLRGLDRATQGGAKVELLDALDRSANGLDRDYPLKWQPNAMKNFFEFAAKTLRQIDRG